MSIDINCIQFRRSNNGNTNIMGMRKRIKYYIKWKVVSFDERERLI